MGSLLFIPYKNDLLNCLDRAKILSYADGTVIFYSSKTVEKRYISNILILHKGKTEMVLFGSGYKMPSVPDNSNVTTFFTFTIIVTLFRLIAKRLIKMVLNDFKSLLKKYFTQVTQVKATRKACKNWAGKWYRKVETFVF